MSLKDAGECEKLPCGRCLNCLDADGNPLDLSISVRGGEETNTDSPSSGE